MKQRSRDQESAGRGGGPTGSTDIAIVPEPPCRRARDVDISWEVDAFTFDLPLMASPPWTGVRRPTAIGIGRSAASASQPRGPVDPLRGPRGALPGDRRAARPRGPCACGTSTRPDHPRAHRGDIRQIKDAGVSVSPPLAVTPRTGPSPKDPRRRARPARHPGRCVCVRQARLQRPSSPSTSSASSASSTSPSIGGRLRQLLNRSPIAHPVPGVLVRRRPSQPATRGVLGIGVPQAPPSLTPHAARMRHLDGPALRPRHRRRRHGAPAATSPRPSSAAPTPS